MEKNTAASTEWTTKNPGESNIFRNSVFTPRSSDKMYIGLKVAKQIRVRNILCEWGMGDFENDFVMIKSEKNK